MSNDWLCEGILTKDRFYTWLDDPNLLGDCLTLDIETGGADLIDYNKGKIVSVSVTNANNVTTVIGFEHPESELYNSSHNHIRELIEQLDHTDAWLLTWNGAFDLKWLAHHGGYTANTFPFFDERVIDVKLMARSRFSPPAFGEGWRKDLSLKAQAIEHLGVEPWADINFKAGEQADTTSFDKLAVYNAKDTLYTAQLYDYFNSLDDAYSQLDDIMQQAWRVLMRAEYVGIPVRESYLQTVAEKLRTDCDSITADLFSIAESADISIQKKYKKSLAPTSKFFQKLMAHMFGQPRKVTATGKPSWDKEVLKELAYEGEKIAEDILTQRQLEKAWNFTQQWRSRLQGRRLHPDFNFCATRTGRTSCHNPNFQQTPRLKELRQCIGFDPGSPWQWIEADYSQIELRVAAYLFNATEMLEAFEAGQDLHQLLAEEITGLPYEECVGEIRTQAKIANFGFLYGMQANTFVRYAFDSFNMRFTDREAARIRKAFFTRWPSIARAHQMLPGIVKQQGYIEGLFGRTHDLSYIWEPDSNMQYKAYKRSINYPVQGSASDIVLHATPSVAETFRDYGGELVANIHDALCGYAPRDVAIYAAKDIKKAMETSPVPGLPLVADVSIGTCWYGDDTVNI